MPNEPAILHKFFQQSMGIGVASIAVPFGGAMVSAHDVSGWEWSAARCRKFVGVL